MSQTFAYLHGINDCTLTIEHGDHEYDVRKAVLMDVESGLVEGRTGKRMNSSSHMTSVRLLQIARKGRRIGSGLVAYRRVPSLSSKKAARRRGPLPVIG